MVGFKVNYQEKIIILALMLNAGIPDIAIEPDKTLHKVKDKLKLGKFSYYNNKVVIFAETRTLKTILELDDEEAVKHMQNIIDQSVSSFMA